MGNTLMEHMINTSNLAGNTVTNCASVKKYNEGIARDYYVAMDNYITNKNIAYSNFSAAINMITPSTFNAGETYATRELEAAVVAAKAAWDNITPPTKNELSTTCCVSDNTLYLLRNKTCIPETMSGTYRVADNVYSNKVSFKNTSSPDVNSCALACSTDKNCYQALYNKNSKKCYLMGKDDPKVAYSYLYSTDYTLLTSPSSANTSATNIPIKPSSSVSDNNADTTDSSTSIIIIVVISVSLLFLLLMFYLLYSRKSGTV